jgi:CRP-like cAMP-binding protein
MEHQTFSSPKSSLMPERAPLTRLRVSTRSSSTPVPGIAAPSLLPDMKQWGSLFGGGTATSAEVTALGEVARARRVMPGAMVFACGDRARALVLVVDGDVALGVRNADGSFHTERHIHGPAWLDISAGWLGECHALDARAMSATSVLELPREALQQVLDRFPSLARRLITSLAREVRALAVNTHDLMHKDAPARLAAWLHERCLPHPQLPNQGLVQLPMRKRDIASQLAITPETLSRLMRSFTSRGVINVAGYSVHVLDMAALARQSGVA